MVKLLNDWRVLFGAASVDTHQSSLDVRTSSDSSSDVGDPTTHLICLLFLMNIRLMGGASIAGEICVFFG